MNKFFILISSFLLVNSVLFINNILREDYFVLLSLLILLIVLISEKVASHIALFSALIFFLTTSLIKDKENPMISFAESFKGFSEQSVITIAALFIIASAISKNNLLQKFINFTLGNSKNVPKLILRLFIPLSSLSALLNNTPIVALFIPPVRDWAKKHNICISKILIPLSYITIFGGCFTLIGTSTFLIVNDLYFNHTQNSFNFFDFGLITIPCSIVSLLYLAFIGYKFLPNKNIIQENQENLQQYLFAMNVEEQSQLIGKSVHESKLRDYDEIFLLEIKRGDTIIAPVRREMILQENDTLIFSTSKNDVLNLHKIQGLSNPEVCTDLQVGKFSELKEVMISNQSTLVGKTIDELWFNRHYDATVLTLHRNGNQIQQNMAQTPLKSGDILLLLAGFGFTKIWQKSKDFISLNTVQEEHKDSNKNTFFLFSCLLVMILLPIFNIAPIHYTSVICASIFVLNNRKIQHNVFQSINWNIIIIIASSFALSKVLENSNAANTIAQLFYNLSLDNNPILILALLYILTNITTEFITNAASIAIFFPIALQISNVMGLSPAPFIITCAIASAASFSSPIGYQTNMMVYAAGNYKYKDFFKVGIIINIIFFIGTILLAPKIWPF